MKLGIQYLMCLLLFPAAITQAVDISDELITKLEMIQEEIQQIQGKKEDNKEKIKEVKDLLQETRERAQELLAKVEKESSEKSKEAFKIIEEASHGRKESSDIIRESYDILEQSSYMYYLLSATALTSFIGTVIGMYRHNDRLDTKILGLATGLTTCFLAVYRKWQAARAEGHVMRAENLLKQVESDEKRAKDFLDLLNKARKALPELITQIEKMEEAFHEKWREHDFAYFIEHALGIQPNVCPALHTI